MARHAETRASSLFSLGGGRPPGVVPTRLPAPRARPRDTVSSPAYVQAWQRVELQPTPPAFRARQAFKAIAPPPAAKPQPTAGAAAKALERQRTQRQPRGRPWVWEIQIRWLPRVAHPRARVSGGGPRGRIFQRGAVGSVVTPARPLRWTQHGRGVQTVVAASAWRAHQRCARLTPPLPRLVRMTVWAGQDACAVRRRASAVERAPAIGPRRRAPYCIAPGTARSSGHAHARDARRINS